MKMQTLDLTPPKKDLLLYRGDTQAITFKYRIRSTKELQSLAGATALMQLKMDASSNTVLYTFPLTVDEVNNVITMLISDWSQITPLLTDDVKNVISKETVIYKLGVFDLQVTYSNNIKETWFKGALDIMEDISHG